MKIKILATCFAFAAILACNKKAETETSEPEATPEVATPEPAQGKQCYQYVKNKDTISMSLAMNANNANGELTYNLFEKDKNTGTLSGVFIGDTLYADYSFNSEGMTSVREAVFVRSGDKLIQGTGDMEEKNNKQVFVNAKKLSFDSSIVLMKTECK